jgi:hypothetical protein
MIALLELIITRIYRVVYRVRIHWIVNKYGYQVTSIKWLPDSNEDRTVRITPTNDGFPHTGDDCACEPEKSVRTDDKGEEYILIEHREVTNDLQA